MDSTKRFSDRVENYVKYRPSYPAEAIDFLVDCGVHQGSVLCDVGSGTGILTGLLLPRVATVFAVEPNKEMRSFAESQFKDVPAFHSVEASAEDTGLEEHSVDAVCAAQAFHWFDLDACKKEFQRILKPGGKVFLIWNRRLDNSEFLQKYDEFLVHHSRDYTSVNHLNLQDQDFRKFFGSSFEMRAFDNYQVFDLEGFLGRVFSSSYTPSEKDPEYEDFREGLTAIFHRYQQEGCIRFNYQTEVIWGVLIS